MKIDLNENDHGLNYQDWEYLIDAWIFNETHRKMLKRNLLDGCSYKDLSKEFGYELTYVPHLMAKLKVRLFSKVDRA